MGRLHDGIFSERAQFGFAWADDGTTGFGKYSYLWTARSDFLNQARGDGTCRVGILERLRLRAFSASGTWVWAGRRRAARLAK
jgi:hypothetical protein